MANRFDELLAAIPDASAPGREALKALGDQHPEVRTILEQGFLRQDEFSRRMDEVRDKVKYAEDQTNWFKENWVPDAYGAGKGAFRAVLEKDKELEQLREQIATTGGDVNFADVEKYVTEQMARAGVATKTDLSTAVESKFKEGSDQFNAMLAAYADISTKVPALVIQHKEEFGEYLNVNELCSKAADAGAKDINEFYNKSYVADRRADKAKKDQEAAVVAAREEGVRQGRLEATSHPSGGVPVDLDGPQVGNVEMAMRRMGQQNNQPPVYGAGSELGDHAISREAAVAGDKQEFASRAS